MVATLVAPILETLNIMLAFFRRRKLRKSFSKYIHVLGPELVKRYGLQDQFTVMQVQTTIEHLKLDNRFIAYAVALYRYEESENTLEMLRVDQTFLDQLRSEIANSLFEGNTKYSSKKVLELSKKLDGKAATRQTGWRIDMGVLASKYLTSIKLGLECN